MEKYHTAEVFVKPKFIIQSPQNNLHRVCPSAPPTNHDNALPKLATANKCCR